MTRVIKSVFLLALIASCTSSREIGLPAGVDILTRAQWNARSPVLPVRTHIINRITIHHTAVKQNSSRSLADKLRGLQKFSMEKSPLSDGRIKEAWADIPYHFYIASDGAIGEGRQLKYVGDSNTPYDPTGHALIVLEGNFNVEVVSPQQYSSLEKLTSVLSQQYRVDSSKISGHKDHAETACPGNNLYNLLPSLKTAIARNFGH